MLCNQLMTATLTRSLQSTVIPISYLWRKVYGRLRKCIRLMLVNKTVQSLVPRRRKQGFLVESIILFAVQWDFTVIDTKYFRMDAVYH